jgi:hypothetical protein
VSAEDVDRARRSWREAENHLYPLAMSNVDGYQRAVTLVAGVRELLRERAASAADLVALRSDAAELVADACDATGTSPAGLDVDDVFGAAAAARDRELAGQERRRTVLAAIAAAQAAGDTWVDVRGEALGPRLPELRVHAPSGRGILTTMSFDPEKGTPVLHVTPVQVDLATGDVAADPAAAVRAVESGDDWSEIVLALQQSIDRLP